MLSKGRKLSFFLAFIAGALVFLISAILFAAPFAFEVLYACNHAGHYGEQPCTFFEGWGAAVAAFGGCLLFGYFLARSIRSHTRSWDVSNVTY